MSFYFHINILTVAFSLTIALSSKGQQLEGTKGFQFDTSKTAIILFDKKNTRVHPFDTSYRSALLTQNEIKGIDSLLIVSVNNYNDTLKRKCIGCSIDLTQYNYKKQLMAVTNSKGEKEVFVNCFCNTFDIDWGNRWKTDFFIVSDGGACFFQFKINLTTMKVYGFGINGLG